VKVNRALLALAVSAALVALSACESNSQPKGDAPEAAAATPTAADADAFVARVNEEAKADYPEAASAQWIASTYINSDSQLVAAKANERSLAKLGANVEASKQYSSLQLKPETARGIHLLKLATSMPAPKDPKKLSELTQIATKMEGMYGAGKYCTGEGDAKEVPPAGRTRRHLAQQPRLRRAARRLARLAHDLAADARRLPALRRTHQRRLEGTRIRQRRRNVARRLRHEPGGFEKETDRLWDQVKPLYDQLHCYVKGSSTEVRRQGPVKTA
jgi:peptidyl-dipeptidase A